VPGRRFDQSSADAFIQALRASLTAADAAAYAGIDVETVEQWRHRRSFDAEVRRVQAEVALLDAGRVRQAAREDWRASLMLARQASQERELERLRRLTTDARS
jgi:hypothetical protein